MRLDALTPGGRKILDAASLLFYRHGIHSVGVASIAAMAGVTKKSLYDTFGSKDRLILAYLQLRREVWAQALKRALAESPEPRALAFFDAQSDSAQDHSRGCAFINAAGELPADHPGRDFIGTHKRYVRTRLLEVLRSDGLHGPDLESVTDHLFLLHEGALAQVSVTGLTDAITTARHHAHVLLEAHSLTVSTTHTR